MRALEDLLNNVRDRESRRYLEEAIRAYNVGAFRAAIVATWVAVAFDLIAKIRQLAASGDAAANDFIRTLDQAIEADNTNRLLRIERNLLTVAHETFEFIEHRELKELERLRDDRHVCAHPAFVRPTEVFEPPPELVRAHIATAVDAVLSKGPTPGRRAIERFKEESSGIPSPDLRTTLRGTARQVLRAGQELARRGLAELIVKGCLDRRNRTQPRVTRRYAMAARRWNDQARPAHRGHVDRGTRREEGPGLSDDELLSFAANLGDMTLAWQALPRTLPRQGLRDAQKRGRTTARRSRHLACALTAEAREAVDARLGELDDVQLAEVIGQEPDSRRFGPAAIAALQQSGQTTERRAASWGRSYFRSRGTMTDGQVRSVLACLQDNPQMRMAADMPPLFAEFFDGRSTRSPSCYRTGSSSSNGSPTRRRPGTRPTTSRTRRCGTGYIPRAPELALEVGLLELEHAGVLGDDPLLSSLNPHRAARESLP